MATYFNTFFLWLTTPPKDPSSRPPYDHMTCDIAIPLSLNPCMVGSISSTLTSSPRVKKRETIPLHQIFNPNDTTCTQRIVLSAGGRPLEGEKSSEREKGAMLAEPSIVPGSPALGAHKEAF